MGQGLHTKMIQVAARTLQVPEGEIHLTETNTTKVPNMSGTAASTGSDLNGGAVKVSMELRKVHGSMPPPTEFGATHAEALYLQIIRPSVRPSVSLIQRIERCLRHIRSSRSYPVGITCLLPHSRSNVSPFS